MFDTKYLTIKFAHYILTDMFGFKQGEVYNNLQIDSIDPEGEQNFHTWTKIREYCNKGQMLRLVTEWDDVIGFYDKRNKFVRLNKDEKSFNKLVLFIKKF